MRQSVYSASFAAAEYWPSEVLAPLHPSPTSVQPKPHPLCIRRTHCDPRTPSLASWRDRILHLTALSADEPERLVRFLTGALLACGGWILTRVTQGDQAAELDFEFARACCVEIYAVVIAAGLELSRDSHLQLTDLCHCTCNLLESRAYDIAHVDLTVHRAASVTGREDYTPALAA